MKKAIATFILLTTASLVGSDKPKSIIHVSHLTPTEVGITCANGGDPTGNKIGDVLIISCGKD